MDTDIRAGYSLDIIGKIEKIIGYTFSNKELLVTAFTHSSFTNEFGEKNNEKLEFLGDSLLGFIVSEYLYDDIESEGGLTAARAKIVSAAPLALTVEKMDILQFMRLGAGAAKESQSQKFVSDLFEAILGAIYLDGGIGPCKKFVLNHLDISNHTKCTDYKTQLQEYIQRSSDSSNIVYTADFDAIEKTFTATVTIFGRAYGIGTGKRKKEAEQNAAKTALERMKNEE